MFTSPPENNVVILTNWEVLFPIIYACHCAQRNESNTGQNIRSYEVYLFCVTQCALSTDTYGIHVG